MAERGPIEFNLLGPIEALFGDRRLPLGGAKQRTVLALLLLRPNEVVPLERLVDELWASAHRPRRSTRLRATSPGFAPC